MVKQEFLSFLKEINGKRTYDVVGHIGWNRSFTRLDTILTAASTFAGDSSLGSANIEITLMSIVSTVWIGNQRSEGLS